MNRAFFLVGLSFALASASAVVDAQTKPAAPVQAQPNPADAAFTVWDVDHSGSLSPQEFRNGWEQVRRATQFEAQLRRQFMTIDVNKSGTIDPSEYNKLILVKSAGKSAPPLSSFDANKDGKLQFGEYLKLVQTLAPKEAAKGKAQ
ncbi:EF-hand domain-containing protein [Thermomonas sp.]|uniref:EF-hand domain-containing protein n=1 Tax=Thermomonas sp. TaxID=1971895 RepID=UPI00248981A9|nr:EF-hand domain-containing protein [Thermomonas sp.]MDI1252303.1 EF-hand domain-containing protein [Thermomonas sp.]